MATIVVNTVKLNWNESPESDLRFYVIYRDGISYDSTSQNNYTDTNVEIGQSYSYKLTAIDVHDNESDFSEEVVALFTRIDIVTTDLPKSYQLFQNYPNPFNTETFIQYQLPATGDVELIIYNVTGQGVRILIKGQKNAGYHHIKWDGNDDKGIQVPSGLYLYQLRATEFIQTKKMLFLK